MDIHAITTQEILDRIARHCPRALSVYLQCINRANADGLVHFTRSMVTIEMSESWCIFKNSIKKLAQLDLLGWVPLDGGISVTLADVYEE